MSEWVRDPRAIYTILAMKMLEVGDELDFQDNVVRVLDHVSKVRHCHEWYANQGLSWSRFRITGWRRPTKEEADGR